MRTKKHRNINATLGKTDKRPQLIDRPNETSKTALHIACLEGHIDIVRMLIEAGCDSDARDRQGCTALHFACCCKHKNALKICQLLLRKKSCFLSAQNNVGAIPLFYFACNRSCKSDILYYEIFNGLIDGVDVNIQDKKGQTVLHQAALEGFDEIILMLVNTKRIAFNILDEQGETCLHFAARGGHVDTAKILLDVGFNYSIVGNNGTCLEVAEKEGHFQLMEFFREWESQNLQNQTSSTHNNINNSNNINNDTNNKNVSTKLQMDVKQEPSSPILPLPTHEGNDMGSIVFDKKLLEGAEMKGIDPSVAFACLYQLQLRGAPISLDVLVEEANRYQSQMRECIVCLEHDTNALFLPCRHSAACFECAQSVKSSSGLCPICREDIKEVMKIFLS